MFVLPVSPANLDGTADIQIIAINGKPRALTGFAATGGRGIQPTWTPAGDRVIFVVEDIVRSKPNAAFITADGAAVTRLPADNYVRTHPRLRPSL